MLRNGQLLVDRYAVSKIGKIEYLPHNTVTVQLINQLTGEEAERNLRWDEYGTSAPLQRSSIASTVRRRR
jgi:hypothetical protein